MPKKTDSPASTSEPYAVATVVRTVAVTAAKAGAKAMIGANGEIAEGWIGGGCAKAAVQKAAMAAIADGQPRLISILPDDGLKLQGVSAGDQKDGIHFARNMCPSQGSMDVFIEPVLPKPQLLIIGSSPVAQSLADLAAMFELSVDRFACGPSERFAVDTNETAHRFIVIATQGRGDEAALRAALDVEFDYLGFVGSQAKAEALRQSLSSEPDLLPKLRSLRCPAGLDLGAIGPEEIALSILAEIIQLLRSRRQNP